MWLTSALSGFFYRVADVLYPNRGKLWLLLVVGVALAAVLTFLNASLYPAAGSWAFNLISAILLITLVGLSLLIPCVGTFHRLRNESGVFRNHGRQELAYSLGYALVFMSLVIILVFFVYAVLFLPPDT